MTIDDAIALSEGTKPSALSAADGLLAYWDFNDAPKGDAIRPTVSISVDSTGKAVLTYTGTLQSANSVQGPFSTVAGASSPFSIPPTSTVFFRTQQ